MTGLTESTAFPTGLDRILQKLDEQSALHMRTREDLVEVKSDVRALKERAVHHDERQSTFERAVTERITAHAIETDKKIGQIEDTVEGVSAKLTDVREERIAEKAQWRGPEKVIALLITLAGVLGLFVAIKDLFFR